MRAKPSEFEIGNKKNGLWYKAVIELIIVNSTVQKRKDPQL